MSSDPGLPSQALILCGGMGTRLRPLTDTTPKPMVEVGGRPFLEYLLEQLCEQGIARFVLATGYLGEQVSHHFGAGSRWGWEIRYSHGPVDWDTGRRLYEAAEMLDERFVLMYSDNFAPFDLEALSLHHHAGGRAITVTLKDRVRGNVAYEEEAGITAYDPARGGEGLAHVEIGYAVVERDEILGILSTVKGQPDVSFSEVLALAATDGRLSGFPTLGPYYSISDPTRLEQTAEYLAPKRILLLDRDGTINKKRGPGEYVETWDDFQFIPETIDALRSLSSEGFEFIVITNQAGVALGLVDEVDVDRIHKNMTRELGRLGIEVLDVYVCPDHWESGSLMRKPAPGMFFLASNEHCFRLDRVLYVGDDVRDCEAAAAAGCGMVLLAEPDEIADIELPANPRHRTTHRTLVEAVGIIGEYYEVGERS